MHCSLPMIRLQLPSYRYQVNCADLLRRCHDGSNRRWYTKTGERIRNIFALLVSGADSKDFWVVRQFEKNRNPGDREHKETGRKLSSEPRINFRVASVRKQVSLAWIAKLRTRALVRLNQRVN